MKTKFYLAATFLTLISLTAFMASCSDDDKGDTTPPTINLIDPAEGEELLIGDASGVHLEMELSDNEMLASYKIDIHSNFDGHNHSRAKETETVAFSLQKSWDVSGQKNAHIHHHEIVIPENATPGNYHMMVYCTDAAGNESYVARNIVLSHDAESHEHE